MKTSVMVGVLSLLGMLMIAVNGHSASMRDLLYQGTSGNDMAIFHADKHLKQGLKCTDCHNKDIFPEKKFGAAKITMKSIAAGKHCGFCHNGQKAFGITGKCNMCHPKKSGDMTVYD